jgi:predicted Fe-Mo cluster-binding NifX family protein
MTEPTTDPSSTGPSTTVVAVSLAGTAVGTGWGRAHWVALAQIADGALVGWTEHEVAWDVSHDLGTEGSHHARVVRFCREHNVQVVVTGNLGQSMQNTLVKLGCRLVLGLTGDARAAAVTAAAPGLPVVSTAVPPTDHVGGPGLRSSIVIGPPPGRD